MKPACLLLSLLLCCASGAFGAVWHVDKASPTASAAAVATVAADATVTAVFAETS